MIQYLNNMESLEKMIKSLPPELRDEARDYIEFLIEKHHRGKKKKLSLNWAVDLKKYKEEFTSLELEEKSKDWWGE